MTVGEAFKGPYEVSALLAADAHVFAGACYVDRIEVLVPGATGNSIKIRDGATDAATLKADITPTAAKTYELGIICQTGLFVDIGGTTAPQCHVFYKKLA